MISQSESTTTKGRLFYVIRWDGEWSGKPVYLSTIGHHTEGSYDVANAVKFLDAKSAKWCLDDYRKGLKFQAYEIDSFLQQEKVTLTVEYQYNGTVGE